MDERVVREIFGGIAPIVVIICATWLVSIIIRALKQRANQKNRVDLYSRMLDKFGASPEFMAYLQSDDGLKFIEEAAVETAVSSPMNKILTSIQIGVIASLLGIGLLILAIIFDTSRGGDLLIVLNVAGVVGLMVGVGLLISAGISYKLCKTWGLLDAKEKPQQAQN
jgi:ABC-type Fe3+ transport system permease subunit